MEVVQINSLAQVSRQDWNSLVPAGYPFLRHEFLSALEQTGCVCETAGWLPRHLLVNHGNELIAAMPLYLKTHSWGEYVFDSQWAFAGQHYGVSYYPKWLTAVPFTPCQGERIMVNKRYDDQIVLALLLDTIKDLSKQQRVSSWHCLFPDVGRLASLKELGLGVRQSVQFHWFNKSYRCFDDFLATLNSSKRKMIKRERRRIAEQGISLVQLSGAEVNKDQWRIFFDFYQMTYLKRGMTPYLNLAFFEECAARMGENMLMVLAMKGRDYVGAALSFVGGDTLYGRYWGCLDEYDVLHFEACYYQGLDYCIAQGLQHFDSGAQGEHKIARGFEPVITYSAHWFQDAEFAAAIERFLTREKNAIEAYKQDAETYLPFKKAD